MKKYFFALLTFCLCSFVLSACVYIDYTHCYKEGFNMSDKNCLYTCKGGNWVSSCENKELENCLNYIDFDLPYCMKRAGIPYSNNNDNSFGPVDEDGNDETLNNNLPDESGNR